MAGVVGSAWSVLRARKKLLAYIVIGYVVFLLGYYQIRYRGWTTSAGFDNQVSSEEFRETIRYVFHGNGSHSNVSARLDQSNASSAGAAWEGNGDGDVYLDIHIEHPALGHNGDALVIGGNGTLLSNGTGNRGQRTHHMLLWENAERRLKSIAIGGGLTSRKIKDLTTDNIPAKFQLFDSILPSFCKTATSEYDYHFYFAYDNTDKFFTDVAMQQAFRGHFLARIETHCQAKGIRPSLHMVQCSHAGHPTWAQNDAMMEAYLDGVEYFYRVNDDSIMETPGWTPRFVGVLGAYDPPNVGVVGPMHKGGNVAILTYDFVQRSHINVFGVYYPRLFKDWWADDWITKVYQPGRSTKVKDIKLTHTMKMGQRYAVTWDVGKQLSKELDKDRKILQRYLKSKTAKNRPKTDGTKVIAMSLYGSDQALLMGAIRNAQLMPVLFPGWALRVYVAQGDLPATDPEHLVPERVLYTLKALGCQLAFVNDTHQLISPKLWKYLVADDARVQVFLVRNARSRLSEREAAVVADWLAAPEADSVFHCVRDHPDHVARSVVDGLWGARAKAFRQLLPTTMGTLLKKDLYDLAENLNASARSDFSLLTDILWPLARDSAYCHDSVSCDQWPRSVPFPVSRSPSLAYLGQRFDQFQDPADESAKQLEKLAPPQRCRGIVPAPTAQRPLANETTEVTLSGNSSSGLTEEERARLKQRPLTQQKVPSAPPSGHVAGSHVLGTDKAGNQTAPLTPGTALNQTESVKGSPSGNQTTGG